MYPRQQIICPQENPDGQSEKIKMSIEVWKGISMSSLYARPSSQR